MLDDHILESSDEIKRQKKRKRKKMDTRMKRVVLGFFGNKLDLKNVCFHAFINDQYEILNRTEE